MTKFEIFKEKLKICYRLWKSDQYFFASYRGDMSAGVQVLGKKNLACYNSEPTYPMFIRACEKMCSELKEQSEEKWIPVGEQIGTYGELFWLLDHGIYCYVSLPDDFNDNTKRLTIKGNIETKHIEVWESSSDGKKLFEYETGDEMKDKLWDVETEKGKIFYYLRYEPKETSE